MITLDMLILTVRGLDAVEVECWIAQGWVRPAGGVGAWEFREIDVARLHLIRDLRGDLGLHEDAMPLVLRLLDQLYDERRRLRRLRDALDKHLPVEMREAVLLALLDGTETIVET